MRVVVDKAGRRLSDPRIARRRRPRAPLAAPLRLRARGVGRPVSVPLRQSLTVARYLAKQRLRKNDKFPLLVELEPLFQCNLACSFCGKIQYPDHILKKRMPVEQALAAIDESGAPMVSIAGGEPLVHPEVDVIARELIRAQEVRLPVHERDPDEEEDGSLRAVALLRVGRAPRTACASGTISSSSATGIFDKAVDAIRRRSGGASASTRTRRS
jgi:hypothetical protein